jgi:flagellar hook-length control protein FliK
MDRAGEVRVSVRAPNEEVAGTLRQDLGSLTGKLNQSGYTTEAFTPSRGSTEFSRDQKTADQQQQNGSERQSSGRNQQQSSQQEGRGKRPAWLDEFENSLAT